VAVIIQIRRDTGANWASTNPVLAQGEIGQNLDNELIKIGDGVTNWSSLDYYGATASGIVDHGNLSGLGDDDHPQYHNDLRGDLRYYTQEQIDAIITTISGQLDDHSELNGLGNDDHTQYLLADGTRSLSNNWNAGDYSITAKEYYGDGATLSGISYVDGDDVYFYDTTRSKDLGVAVLEIGCGRNSANTTDQYLRTFNGTPMNQTGVALPFDATLVGMSMSGQSNTQTWTAQVGKNDLATVEDSLTITNAYENHTWSKDTDFSAGDRIQVYLSGTNINYPQVRLYFRRTK
jgi:hypothetical protein